MSQPAPATPEHSSAQPGVSGHRVEPDWGQSLCGDSTERRGLGWNGFTNSQFWPFSGLSVLLFGDDGASCVLFPRFSICSNPLRDYLCPPVVPHFSTKDTEGRGGVSPAEGPELPVFTARGVLNPLNNNGDEAGAQLETAPRLGQTAHGAGDGRRGRSAPCPRGCASSRVRRRTWHP